MNEVGTHVGTQVALPLAQAWELVAQGLRVRASRALVTLLGVALGAAFLASTLSGGALMDGLREVERARQEATRMRANLERATGPLDGRTIAVLEIGGRDDAERHLVEALIADGVELRAYDALAALDGASALVVVGDGAVPQLDRAAIVARLRQPVIASTRATGSADALALRPPLAAEDALRLDQQGRVARFRAWWLAGIAAATGACAVATAMLMAVGERFREIGTMRCLGAPAATIRRLVVLEALAIGAAAGVIGAPLGVIASLAAQAGTYGFAPVVAAAPWTTLVAYAIGAGLATAALAVIAALYPARVAARLSPAAALRSEM